VADQLTNRKAEALAGGSAAAVARLRARGKLTARERIDWLVDDGSFREVDMFARRRARDVGLSDGEPYTDGVVVGFGRVQGRRIGLFAQDPTIVGGSVGEVGGEKITKMMDMAGRAGVPIVGINDGGGARIQEGVAALAAYGQIFRRNAGLSGVVPQISVIMGASTGGAVYSPAMTDFVFMVEGTAQMSITGPDVVRTETGEDVTLEELGGAQVHATRSGAAHFVAADDGACLEEVRRLLSYLPPNARVEPPRRPPSDDPTRACPALASVLPDNPTDPYDVRRVLREVVDDGELFEYGARWAANVLCGFARLDGHPVGLVANQPAVLAGVLDIDGAEKAARFVRTCDAFNLPLLAVVDVPGFRPGVDQEHGGIIRRGAKLLYAFAEATVPRVQLVTRRAYGAAFVAMNSRSIGADFAFAWPEAEIAVMGPQGAVDTIHRHVIASAPDRDTVRAELIAEYRASVASAFASAERGFIDEIIEPASTRAVIIDAFDYLRDKRHDQAPRKHGNVPL
jgi:acetyl-CoA carboxylase carboxyltransferase component